MEYEKIVERENEISIDGGDKESSPELQSLPPQLQSPQQLRSPAPPAACRSKSKYCHQCRHKASDPLASCKIVKRNKRCCVSFCQKCLLNRYGEDAAEMAVLDDWKCPKCRGICNCSTCMKKRGQKPTGFLKAKKLGYSSVSELLCHTPPELFDRGNTVQERDLSNGSSASADEAVVRSPCMLGKDDGSFGTNLHFQTLKSNGEQMNPEKIHCDGLRDISNGKMLDDSLNKSADNGIIIEGGGNSCNGEIEELHGVGEFGPECVKKGKSKKRKDKEKHHEGGVSDISQMDEALLEPMIPLPEVAALTAVAGINNIPVEAIGDTLQFLEFCAAFDELLDFHKGYAKSVIGELLSGRSKRSGRVSLAVQFQLLLLSLIQEDLGDKCSPYPTNGKHSWLKAVGKYVSQSKCELKEISPDFIDEAVNYHELDFSKKIRILNFLCDEALKTEYFRSYIDEQNNKFIEMVKGAKVHLQAARDKEKLLKQKLQDESGNFVSAEGGAPDSVSEQESIASQMKDEISQTQADILEMTNKLSEKGQASDVIRMEPLIVDADGRVLWKLKTYTDEPGILLQEIGNQDSVTSDDKWFFFDAGKKSSIDGYISSLSRRKKFRKHVVL